MKRFLTLLLLMLALGFARELFAFGGGEPNLGKLGVINDGIPVAVAPPCPSPTAPNGAIDFSVCSNLTYVAVIF